MVNSDIIRNMLLYCRHCLLLQLAYSYYCHCSNTNNNTTNIIASIITATITTVISDATISTTTADTTLLSLLLSYLSYDSHIGQHIL